MIIYLASMTTMSYLWSLSNAKTIEGGCEDSVWWVCWIAPESLMTDTCFCLCLTSIKLGRQRFLYFAIYGTILFVIKMLDSNNKK